MGIIAFIILGLLAGTIAKAIMPGDDPGGWIITAIIGIAGAIIGGFLAGASSARIRWMSSSTSRRGSRRSSDRSSSSRSTDWLWIAEAVEAL